MGIHVLDNSLINKIAAGEVVERPASVVKELVENSIDAGATSVTIEIKGGGIDMIKITDNGKGIPKDEISSAFLRHATSKLSKLEDLDSILTLGFRGEALSSIASVSQVELITKTAEDETGTKFCISGGIKEDECQTGANNGTVFTMKNLFFNTPARRKFLKKPATEGTYISEVVNRIALGHPHIAVKYINNGNSILYTSGNNDLKAVIMRIYGRDVAANMLEINVEKNGYKLSGLIAKPIVARANRSYENFFINGRYIKSTLVQEAVQEAYKGKLMIGKFPVFALNMTVPSSTVDVNVHPTKLEVRFADESFIYDLIYTAVNKVLSNTNLIVEASWGKDEKKTENKDESEIVYKEDNEKQESKNESETTSKEDNEKTNSKDENGYLSFNEITPQSAVSVPTPPPVPRQVTDNADMISGISLSKESLNQLKAAMLSDNETTDIPLDTVIEKNDIPAPVKEEPKKKPKVVNAVLFDDDKETKKPFFNNYKIVGQVFNTYWIIEQNGSLYLIDQHAAHERAIYEELTEKLKNKESVSQLLVVPVVLKLTQKQKLTLEENKEKLEELGFELDEFGVDTYALRAVPCVFNSPGNAGFFIDILDTLADKDISNIYETQLDAIATMSCKAAVKGNDRLSYTEAEALIQKLLKLENPFTCPHGRPTIIEMSKYELEKKFKRIQ